LEKVSPRRIHLQVDHVEVQKREVLKTEDPKSQTEKHPQPDQPIKNLLKDVSQIVETISKDIRPLYLALLDDSLRFCKQPVCLEKVDDTHWRAGLDLVQIPLVTDG
jgi:hypothetical protein